MEDFAPAYSQEEMALMGNVFVPDCIIYSNRDWHVEFTDGIRSFLEISQFHFRETGNLPTVEALKKLGIKEEVAKEALSMEEYIHTTWVDAICMFLTIPPNTELPNQLSENSWEEVLSTKSPNKFWSYRLVAHNVNMDRNRLTTEVWSAVRRYEQNNGNIQNTKWLFHGTLEDAAHEIMTTQWLPSVSGEGGPGMYTTGDPWVALERAESRVRGSAHYPPPKRRPAVIAIPIIPGELQDLFENAYDVENYDPPRPSMAAIPQDYNRWEAHSKLFLREDGLFNGRADVVKMDLGRGVTGLRQCTGRPQKMLFGENKVPSAEWNWRSNTAQSVISKAPKVVIVIG